MVLHLLDSSILSPTEWPSGDRPYYVVLLGSVHRFNSLNNSRVLFSPPSESLSKVTSRGRRSGSNRLHHNWDNDHE